MFPPNAAGPPGAMPAGMMKKPAHHGGALGHGMPMGAAPHPMQLLASLPPQLRQKALAMLAAGQQQGGMPAGPGGSPGAMAGAMPPGMPMGAPPIMRG